MKTRVRSKPRNLEEALGRLRVLTTSRRLSGPELGLLREAIAQIEVADGKEGRLDARR